MTHLMTLLAEPSVWLLGQGRVGNLSQRFRKGTELDSHHLLMFLAVAGTVALVAWLITRYVKHRETCGAPGALFRELCRVHELDWSDRQLVRGLSRLHGVPAASLFVHPERFDDSELGPLALRADQVRELREKLFAR